jgi:hypothetical protein
MPPDTLYADVVARMDPEDYQHAAADIGHAMFLMRHGHEASAGLYAQWGWSRFARAYDAEITRREEQP